ncbi:pyridoxal phosphate-dependent aminotransferase [Peribacillus frigoritolerans]|jgi:aspartate aminotransferase|uniref:pyridoxal phosphate-dependent aminotransferase n=1 Tax=Peribacillus TaxID=2675229 RepID=UPI0007BF6547|nr:MULTISPECIES: pyridoxal phosphate-dependent aminotransferase [Peribacillus]MBD8136392.1 pyridoxal phosphate-dependent aminotransferase [Bacillus sp. CFBP 13597]PEF35141.1 pyridoxal phosphate-dependent aminotransferase [Bacillus sp. AFS094228]PEO45360.1 pyridoxal phosphate-dependent aminotransferase [Bacillus sp. AFS026049]PHD74840.1 pyridoxal phosphate-dependent aminotransferase [Bacillus sp. AFS043905]PRS38758.1 pyridoxal phosphate-dependent aminotransferase [Bacillus sp. RJGP41]QNK47818.
MKLANRVQSLTPSTTLAITAKAKELKAQGLDIIGLGAGEPDYNTPKHIIDAALLSMNEGQTKYTPSAGLPKLKEAIAAKLKRDQGLDYKPSEIAVGSGAKHSLYTLFQAILDEEDEVIVPIPYWVSYPEQIKLADGKPVYIVGTEENQYKITKEQLEQAITDKTKAVIINSPSNPTGMLYSREELAAIGEVCLAHDILIVSDEIYEKLVYGNAKHTSIAEISPELKKQTIIINGVSKSHSMTGWRIGYAAGDESIIKAMANLASHSTSNPTTTAQYGAIAAYEGTQEPVEEMRQAFESRLNKIYDKLVEIPGVSCIKPQGAFYLFPNVKRAVELTGYSNVEDFTTALLEEAQVAVIPGSGFGAPDNIRLSYATSLELLEAAVERIHSFVNSKMA